MDFVPEFSPTSHPTLPLPQHQVTSIISDFFPLNFFYQLLRVCICVFQYGGNILNLPETLRILLFWRKLLIDQVAVLNCISSLFDFIKVFLLLPCTVSSDYDSVPQFFNDFHCFSSMYTSITSH